MSTSLENIYREQYPNVDTQAAFLPDDVRLLAVSRSLYETYCNNIGDVLPGYVLNGSVEDPWPFCSQIIIGEICGPSNTYKTYCLEQAVQNFTGMLPIIAVPEFGNPVLYTTQEFRNFNAVVELFRNRPPWQHFYFRVMRDGKGVDTSILRVHPRYSGVIGRKLESKRKRMKKKDIKKTKGRPQVVRVGFREPVKAYKDNIDKLFLCETHFRTLKVYCDQFRLLFEYYGPILCLAERWVWDALAVMYGLESFVAEYKEIELHELLDEINREYQLDARIERLKKYIAFALILTGELRESTVLRKKEKGKIFGNWINHSWEHQLLGYSRLVEQIEEEHIVSGIGCLHLHSGSADEKSSVVQNYLGLLVSKAIHISENPRIYESMINY